jgi:hypothetical protein
MAWWAIRELGWEAPRCRAFWSNKSHIVWSSSGDRGRLPATEGSLGSKKNVHVKTMLCHAVLCHAMPCNAMSYLANHCSQLMGYNWFEAMTAQEVVEWEMG